MIFFFRIIVLVLDIKKNTNHKKKKKILALDLRKYSHIEIHEEVD